LNYSTPSSEAVHPSRGEFSKRTNSQERGVFIM